MVDSLLTIPAKLHWDVEIVSIIFNVTTICIGLYIAVILNRKIGIATRQKDMLNRYIEQYSQCLNDIERDVFSGTISFKTATSVPYSLQMKLQSLRRIVFKAYGRASTEFDLIAMTLSNQIFSLSVSLDTSVLNESDHYVYDQDQIISIENSVSECCNLMMEMQIAVNKM